jgi:hypothetical protein
MSVIGAAWLEPIARLLDALEHLTATRPNAFQTSHVENGLSAATALLGAVLMESFIRRVQCLERASVFGRSEDYFEELESRVRREELRHLRRYGASLTKRRYASAVREVFMLRDALAHNHIWHSRIGWSDQGELLVAPGRLDRKSGSRTFRQITRSVVRTSKSLRLNLSPTTVWRRDAYTVLNIVLGALAWLHSVDAKYVPSHTPVVIGGKLYATMAELRREVAARLRKLPRGPRIRRR